MLWSGSSPLTAARAGMWGFLMFAGAAWLVVGWSVLRLEPTDLARVAGPIVLFGAVCEGLRALAGTRTWWLNAVLTVLFAATGTVMLLSDDTGWTTTASLIGWYLLVRGAVDVAVGIMTRGVDRVWSLVVTVGVLETALGFLAASPLARGAQTIVVILGALGVLRAIADLVTALRLREIAAKGRDLLELPPERATGLTGYSAGHADYEGPKHRARQGATESFHDQVVRTTADLDRMLAEAGITGPRVPKKKAPDIQDLPPAPDTLEGIENAAAPEKSAGGH
ncbi:hypothetical protein ACWT_1695 [Actinoplanes sp. SE50]|uniref:HdeD family acid-resistance protein n=1 Tax=unclassified Actinoplanes TaxID=2626549 RepID=UPI00023ECFF1|nr:MULTISPECIES: hypothetical protein [unclassified Actinoplanes]AEV82714.1 hypothetical protein ACPL_1817 [Actinoplanes sp. SE50/110]ATO81110.1 hypothetical protein ACWT_1695 [Actinoplanes sp. SE50]SLL98517.1 hypothetical protein ACSP50_1743 [Actinoplanes sp. SE50/110]